MPIEGVHDYLIYFLDSSQYKISQGIFRNLRNGGFHVID